MAACYTHAAEPVAMPSEVCSPTAAAEDTNNRVPRESRLLLVRRLHGVRARRAVLVLAAAVLFPSVTGAAAPWYERYRRGLELEEQGAWRPAVAELSAALRGERAPRALVRIPGDGAIVGYDPHFHLARCLTELGRHRDAAVHLAIAYRAGVTDRKHLAALRKRLEAALGDKPPPRPLESIGQLSVASEPDGAALTIDGVPRGETPAGPLPLPVGEHRVVLEAPGYEPLQQTVQIAVGPNTMTLGLRKLVPPSPSMVPQPTRALAAEPTRAKAAAAETPVTPAEDKAASSLPPEEAAATPSARAVATPQQHSRRLPLGALVLPLALVFAIVVGVWFVRRRRHLPQALSIGAEPKPLPTEPWTSLTGLKNYTITGVLGRGGMATTYRARREPDGSWVALKVPNEVCLADETFVARFLREGALGEQLHHPRIVRIFEAGEADGRPFLAMEMVAGKTLKQWLREGGALPERRALEVARDIAEALDYAHAKGVIHRDLKPENVMITDDGAIRVMDFGIARLTGQEGLTATGLFIGTPLYAAPEMMEPTTIDHRVDLYALGIILFEMLEGVVPFAADSPYGVLEMHRHRPLPAREELARPVSAVVWGVVEHLCAKRPADRYPSAQALLVELNRLLHTSNDLGASDAC